MCDSSTATAEWTESAAVDFSFLSEPLSHRCAVGRTSEFLHLFSALDTFSLNLRCAGLHDLDFAFLSNVQNTLVRLDLSENAWDVAAWGSVHINASGADFKLSELWHTVLASQALKHFSLENAGLPSSLFDVRSAMWIGTQLDRFDSFSVRGNPVRVASHSV